MRNPCPNIWHRVCGYAMVWNSEFIKNRPSIPTSCMAGNGGVGYEEKGLLNFYFARGYASGVKLK